MLLVKQRIHKTSRRNENCDYYDMLVKSVWAHILDIEADNLI